MQLEGCTASAFTVRGSNGRPMPAASTGVRVRTYDLIFQVDASEKLSMGLSTYPRAQGRDASCPRPGTCPFRTGRGEASGPVRGRRNEGGNWPWNSFRQT